VTSILPGIHENPGPTRRQWGAFWALLGVTFITTTLAGLFYALGGPELFFLLRLALSRPGILLLGLPFSLSLLAILLAHEFGHFLACRYYRMQASPPWFIPAPFPLTGTLGAFIRIRSPFRGLRALFDIGIAGPLAGFAVTLPLMAVGFRLSTLVPKGALDGGGLSFGEPLLFRLAGMLLVGYAPARQDLLAHPVVMAAWIGLLVTSLNLLPIWQLDGGHIAYAILGRKRQKSLSIAALGALAGVGLAGWPTPSYLLFAAMLLVIGLRVRFYHPATLDDGEPLGAARHWLALVVLAILVLSFIPVPVEVYGW
jgi:membrane-associated protease RseP (regulator of RpoE activity)